VLANGIVTPGPFVFQAKFVENASAAGANPKKPLMAAVKKECKRIAVRIAQGNWPANCNYFLITNVDASRGLREEVTEELELHIPGINVTVWSGADLCDFLDNTPNLRVAFPQILSLRDLNNLLSQVVNKTVLERSLAAVGEANELAKVFLPTRAYHEALEILQKHSFAVLTGAPEMGKTTIARMIGLAQLTTDWSYFDCYSPDDFFANLDDNTKQIFVADDAFGTTEYQPSLALPWGSQLAKILRQLNSKRWLIWTSRPAPLSFALQRLHLERKASGFPHPSEIKVDASAFNIREKAQILYRHAKAASLSDECKKLVRKYGPSIVESEHFTPERIRRFVSNRLEKIALDLATDRTDENLEIEIIAEIEEPTNRMVKSFENIDSPHQNFMISLLDCNASSVEEADASEAYFRIFRGDADVPPARIAADLEGHFIRIRTPSTFEKVILYPDAEGAMQLFEWIHPSWRDVCIEFLAERKERRTRFLERCSVNGLLLALSKGGGVAGERVMPLLKDEDDWKSLSRSASEIALEGDLDSLEKLASAISVGYPGTSNANRHHVGELGKRILNDCNSRYRTPENSISAKCLASLFELENICGVALMEHHLRVRFQEYIEYASDESGLGEKDSAEESLKELVKLLSLSEEYSPDSFCEFCSGEREQRIFVDSVNLFADYSIDRYALSDSELESESSYLSDLVDLIECVGRHMPIISDELDDTISRLSWERQDIDEELSERETREAERKNEEELEEQRRFEELNEEYLGSHFETQSGQSTGTEEARRPLSDLTREINESSHKTCETPRERSEIGSIFDDL
jgi:hypothetical protein